jgi:hypothetical protein
MKARLIKRVGSFTENYYAIAIYIPGVTVKGREEIIMQTPAWSYPSKSDPDGYDNDGICPQVEKIYQEIIDRINAK